MGIGMCAVRAARAAGLGTRTQSVVNDGLDGARAPTAFGTAAEAAVDLLGIPGKVVRTIDRAADIVVGQDVTGTDNHENEGSFGDAVPDEILKSAGGCKRKKPDFKQFQTAPPTI
jgi:hypothetical protein